MKTDKSTIEYIAHLSRLELDEEQESKMQADLEKILDWVDQLNEVDVEGIEPLYHMTENVNEVREDKARLTFSREQGLKNAPKQNGEYFFVPKVLE